MALKNFVSEVPDFKKDLPTVKGEENLLPCYFTPHYFGVVAKGKTFVSKTPLTLRQIVALLEESGYTESTLYFSETEIKAVQRIEKRKASKTQGE